MLSKTQKREWVKVTLHYNFFFAFCKCSEQRWLVSKVGVEQILAGVQPVGLCQADDDYI